MESCKKQAPYSGRSLLRVVALALSTALIGYAMRDGINFFRSQARYRGPAAPQKCFASAAWSKKARSCAVKAEVIAFR